MDKAMNQHKKMAMGKMPAKGGPAPDMKFAKGGKVSSHKSMPNVGLKKMGTARSGVPGNKKMD